MKIGHEMRPLFDQSRTETRQKSAGKGDFQTLLLKENGELHKERLTLLLSEIEKQGAKLVRSQTITELQQYKRLIERFVKEAVDFGMDLKRSGGWNQSGRREMFTRVEQIDEQLLEVTEAVLKKSEQPIDLIAKVGEIKGLLINLYT